MTLLFWILAIPLGAFILAVGFLLYLRHRLWRSIRNITANLNLCEATLENIESRLSRVERSAEDLLAENLHSGQTSSANTPSPGK